MIQIVLYLIIYGKQDSCRTVTSNKNHDQLKQSTSNNDYKNSSLTMYHQNIRGINNETDELVNQWGFKSHHLILPC